MKNQPIWLRGVSHGARRSKNHASLAKDPAVQIKHCDVCGQTFDTADQDEVFHHGPEPHPPSSARPASSGPAS